MKTIDWHGCYNANWKNVIVDEAFSHPAKFSRNLIRRIYEHALGCGWLKENDVCLDPFAGVALGALDAMFHRLHFVGVELEEKFVALGQQNIDLWNRRYGNGMLPRWGTAVIIQGDSRNLVDVLGGARAAACVSSPPYAGSCGDMKGGHTAMAAGINANGSPRGGRSLTNGYSTNPLNLANMREGDHEAVVKACIGSPPYIGSINQSDEANDADARIKRKAAAGVDVAKPVNIGGPNSVLRRPQVYGSTSGQLGAMPEGDMVKATEYTYNPGSLTPTQFDARAVAESITFTAVPKQEETIECEGDVVKACISSSPYSHPAKGLTVTEMDKKMSRVNQARLQRGDIKGGIGRSGRLGVSILAPDGYSADPDNLGNAQGSTFWEAARVIVGQCHEVLAPGGVAIFVTKRFVRDKKIVEFSQQWADLCESVGFELIEWIRAWLVEDKGTQYTLDGGAVKKVTKHASFFRRLYESKYPENSIDWEDVLCFRKSMTRNL